MKKIGLIGGMSWESSKVYYQLINEMVKEKLGGFHSARCIMDSVDFADIEKLQMANDWNTLDMLMAESAWNLEKAGAKLVMLCTNTMHLCSEAILNKITIPFLHIAEATAVAIREKSIKKVLLLGTKFTMEKDFYRRILQDQFLIEVIIPDSANREIIHNVIYDELVKGKIKASSKREYKRIINLSMDQGAEGVVLACTEIPLLIKEGDVPIPVFDTTSIHAKSAVEFALKESIDH